MRSANSDRPGRHLPRNSSEEGFLLLGAIVAIALVLIVLAIAAPRVARSLRRDREVEAVHRGQQYVRAIQLYYRKFGHYPGSIDQLEHSNMIRFLRQRYTDPITGKDDFATIAVGHNKTTVKTFFGEPLAGLPTGGGLGSISGMVSPGMGQAGAPGAGSPGAFGSSPGSAFGSSSPGGFGSTSPASPTASPTGASATGAPATPGAAAPGAPATPGAAGTTAAGASTSPADSSVGSPSATTFSGTGQPFMGVSLGAHGDSIVEYNAQPTLESWEFLYDPRLDQLKARAAALNGGPGSVPAGSLGNSVTQPGAFGAPSPTAPGTQPPATTPGTTPPTNPGSPVTPPTIGAPVPNQP